MVNQDDGREFYYGSSFISQPSGKLSIPEYVDKIMPQNYIDNPRAELNE